MASRTVEKNIIDKRRVALGLLRGAQRHEAKWRALGQGMIEGLNQGQWPRVIAVGPAVMGGLKSAYGINTGHSGKPGKIFEVTCRKDGTLDEEGLGSIYYGVEHLKIKTMEIFGADLASSQRTHEQIKAANIKAFGTVDVRVGTKNGTWRFEYEKADAGVLCCSDSRVHPYQIFEGSNVVVVSNAGNVLSPVAVEAFTEMIGAGVPVLAILGHSKCGAVGAAMEENKEPMLAEIMRKVRANIFIGNSESARGNEIKNALVAYAMLGGSGGIYGNPDGSVRLQELIREREVARAAFFLDLSNGRASDISSSLD